MIPSRRHALALLLVTATACLPAGRSPRYADVLLPLAVGAQWDYRVVDAQGRVSARSERVVGHDVIGGARVVVLEATQDGTVTRSYVSASDPLVLVLQRESATAGALGETVRLQPGEPRAPLAARQVTGSRFEATWTAQPGDASPITESWVIESAGEDVLVDAGRFRAVRVRRIRPGGEDSVLWFAPGVGLVRRDGEARESLIGYSLP